MPTIPIITFQFGEVRNTYISPENTFIKLQNLSVKDNQLVSIGRIYKSTQQINSGEEMILVHAAHLPLDSNKMGFILTTKAMYVVSSSTNLIKDITFTRVATPETLTAGLKICEDYPIDDSTLILANNKIFEVNNNITTITIKTITGTFSGSPVTITSAKSMCAGSQSMLFVGANNDPRQIYIAFKPLTNVEFFSTKLTANDDINQCCAGASIYVIKTDSQVYILRESSGKFIYTIESLFGKASYYSPLAQFQPMLVSALIFDGDTFKLISKSLEVDTETQPPLRPFKQDIETTNVKEPKITGNLVHIGRAIAPYNIKTKNGIINKGISMPEGGCHSSIYIRDNAIVGGLKKEHVRIAFVVGRDLYVQEDDSKEETGIAAEKIVHILESVMLSIKQGDIAEKFFLRSITLQGIFIGVESFKVTIITEDYNVALEKTIDPSTIKEASSVDAESYRTPILLGSISAFAVRFKFEIKCEYMKIVAIYLYP